MQEEGTFNLDRHCLPTSVSLDLGGEEKREEENAIFTWTACLSLCVNRLFAAVLRFPLLPPLPTYHLPLSDICAF